MSTSNVVRKIDAAAGRVLEDRLRADGFEMRDAPHARFAARGAGVSVTLYTSGKLLVQGKGAPDFALLYLDDPFDEGHGLIGGAGGGEDAVEEEVVGSDESGKGDYFGPLVVAAVLIRPQDVAVLRTLGVRDSKTVPDREAHQIAGEIVDGYGDRVEVIEIGPPKYNELHGQFGRNLNRLLAWCHARAIESLLERHPECGRAVVDRFANERVLRAALQEKGRSIAVEQRVRAESHPAVAAASIVARARFLARLASLGRTADETLPKGAGSPVDAAARRILRDGGMERLATVAKMHFKNTGKAMR